MRIDIITIFPGMFSGPFAESIVRRALDRKLADIRIVNLRDYTEDKRRSVDDRSYGGGTGMIMMIEPIDKAVNALKSDKSKIILLSPRGKVFNQEKALKLSKLEHLILICGHYEGVDERVKNLVDEEISIGDYVLTGGELPAMVLVDSIVRLLPNVLAKPDAVEKESFTKKNLLEYPQYTHPKIYKNLSVPKILLSGNHKDIENWRKKEAERITKKKRPDLLKNE